MSDQPKTSGFLLINKPADWTSFDAVAYLRKVTGIKKIGHAGTLDPLATGLLIVAIGSLATKKIDQYVKLDKIYTTKIKLGETSDSYDAQGKILINPSAGQPTESVMNKTIATMIGPQQQIPPMFSAKKVNGQKLYQLARQGITIDRLPTNIIIHDFQLLSYQYPWVELLIHCSSGTYIRSLVHDLGQSLGYGAVMYQLRREQIGNYKIQQATELKDLTATNWPSFLQ